MIRISQLVLLLCSFTLISALNPSLSKKSFFVSPDNHFSQELFQTRYGIISHDIVNEESQNTSFSQYTLIDASSREATAILASIVSACEFAAPVFQHVHYHVQTDSLVYFCPQNASLLIIDQSSYTVQTSIPFNIDNSFPIAKLSTDGQNIAIICMDTLFNETPKSSFLLKVDMQTQKIVAEILLTTVDPVVAFASTKTAAYIATNHFQYHSLITTVYSLVTIGNTYQVLQLATWRTPPTPKINIITKLFCVGNYIITNNGPEIYFLNQQGGLPQKIPASIKSITADQNGLFQLSMTSTYNSNDFYFISNESIAYKYEMTGYNIVSKQIGSYGDIQVAYANLTSQDLMFAFDASGPYFNIINLQTLQTIYKRPSGFTDGILTNATYSIVQAGTNSSSISIFDLSNDTLITTVPINKNYYFTKEQGIVSFFNLTNNLCYLQHVNLINGSTWSTWKAVDWICNYSIIALTITKMGTPEFVFSLSQDFRIYSPGYGIIQFMFYPKTAYDTLGFNENRGPFNFYLYDANPSQNNITATLYIYDDFNHIFRLAQQNQITNVSATNGFFSINNTKVIALSNDTLTVITEISSTTEKYPTLADWNSAKIFQDNDGIHYAILSKDGLNPALWTYGGYIPLPGLRNESIMANPAGSQSYWVVDAPSSNVGVARFYNVSGSCQEKARISI